MGVFCVTVATAVGFYSKCVLRFTLITIITITITIYYSLLR